LGTSPTTEERAPAEEVEKLKPSRIYLMNLGRLRHLHLNPPRRRAEPTRRRPISSPSFPSAAAPALHRRLQGRAAESGHRDEMSGGSMNAVFYSDKYHPIQVGSIDGTDIAPHDNAVLRSHICSQAGLCACASHPFSLRAPSPVSPASP
jgi:hypothetical protein